MSRRERVFRLALRAYPQSVREAHGPEILGTALDLSEGSVRTTAHESLELLSSGLRTRLAAGADVSRRRLLADSCCLAAMLWGAIELLRWFTFQLEPDPTAAPWQLGLLAAMLVLALAGYDRIAGLCGLAWVALANPWSPIGERVIEPHTWISGVIGRDLVLVIGLCVMVLLPRRSGFTPARLLWPLVLAGAACLDALDLSAPDAPIIAYTVFALAAVSLSPRMAIAAPLWWAGLAVQPLIGNLIGPGPGDFPIEFSLAFLAGSAALIWLALRVHATKSDALNAAL